MANKAIRYRLYPNADQRTMFAKTFGCCRKVYNLMLNDKIESYKKTGKFVAVTPAKYKKDYPFLKEVDSLALANVQLNLQAAFRNHFDKSRKKQTGFPRFKSAKRSRKSSYTTNNQKGTVAIIGNNIKLPKIGRVKAVIHRQPEADWVRKSDNTIGLDYASNGLYVDDKGNIGSNHKYYRESQKKLAKAQRKLSRMQGEKKSNNYLKQLRRVNKIHRHIANQRLDNLHKLSTEIANQYDVVCVESLDMKAMSNKGFGNGKATMDNGYGLFLNMLAYKLDDRGKRLVKVDKWFPSSQICHCCGKVHSEMKDLRIRTMSCDCGLTMSRDQNAAINIKLEGLRILKSV